jgi:hypothetical protein
MSAQNTNTTNLFYHNIKMLFFQYSIPIISSPNANPQRIDKNPSSFNTNFQTSTNQINRDILFCSVRGDAPRSAIGAAYGAKRHSKRPQGVWSKAT